VVFYLVQFIRHGPESFSCTNSSSKLQTIDAFLTSRRNSSRDSTAFKQKILIGDGSAVSPKNGTKILGTGESTQAIKRRLYIKDFHTANIIADSGEGEPKRKQTGTQGLLQSASREFRQSSNSLLESVCNPLQNPNTSSIGLLEHASASKLLQEDFGWRKNALTISQSPEDSVIRASHDSSTKELQYLRNSHTIQLLEDSSDPRKRVNENSSSCNLFPHPGSLSTDLDCLPSDQPTANPSSDGYTDRRLGDIMHSLELFVSQKDQQILHLQCENSRLKLILREHGIKY
jgi:hypothetical protein